VAFTLLRGYREADSSLNDSYLLGIVMAYIEPTFKRIGHTDMSETEDYEQLVGAGIT
jgi:hypothetical protein